MQSLISLSGSLKRWLKIKKNKGSKNRLCWHGETKATSVRRMTNPELVKRTRVPARIQMPFTVHICVCNHKQHPQAGIPKPLSWTTAPFIVSPIPTEQIHQICAGSSTAKKALSWAPTINTNQAERIREGERDVRLNELGLKKPPSSAVGFLLGTTESSKFAWDRWWNEVNGCEDLA